jgi:transcriptional regulator with XRE-family HTH domain
MSRPTRSEIDDPFWIIGRDPKWIKGNFVITIEQIRAARGLLGWSQSELARQAGLSLPTIKRLESGTAARVSSDARGRVQRAFETGGVEFIDENGGGLGVRLRKRLASSKPPSRPRDRAKR